MDPILTPAICYFVARGIQSWWSSRNNSTSSSSSTTTSTPTIERQKHVVFVGRTNSGKSSVANALFNTDFAVGPLHGVTTEVHYRNIGKYGWYAVDTPGILDMHDYSCTALNAVAESKLAVFVSTGQLLNIEHEFLRKTWMKCHGHELIVFVNKLDVRKSCYTSCEMENENNSIRNQVRNVSEHIPVIFGSASPMMRNGQRGQPEIQELREKINEIIAPQIS